jgi:hypothetical protein
VCGRVKRNGGRGIGVRWGAVCLGAVTLLLVVQACGSSSKGAAQSGTTSQGSTAPTTTTSQTTPATTGSSAPPTSSAAGGGNSANVQVSFTGDVTSSLQPDPSAALTCGQTGAQSAVIRGVVGGHRGSLALTSSVAGKVQFPSSHLASAAYLPDGTGGASYSASAVAGTGQGSLTFNQDGSDSVDLVLPYDKGSAGSFNGVSVHVTGTWKC